MPQVPYSPVPDVAAQDLPLRVSVPGEAFGTNIAASVRRMGSQLGEVGNELASRAVAMQELRNQSEATQAVADYMKQGDDRFVQFESLQGRNAVDSEAQHRQDQDDLRVRVRDSLSNDRVRKDFDRAALSIQRQYTISGARHAAGENRKALANASQAIIDSAVSSTRYNQSDEDFQAGLDRIRDAAQDQGVQAGLDKESIDQHVWKWQSAARAKRIQDTSRNDPVAGKKMFDEAMSNGQLHSQDVDKTWNFVNGHLDSTATRTIANGVDADFRNPEMYLTRRGAPRASGLDPVFGQRLTAALMAAERATGETAKINSLVRSTDEQAKLYQKYLDGGNLAAPPGTSRHESGRAVDLQPGKVLDWVREHADQYGLETLKGPRSKFDTVHIQLAAGDGVPGKVRTDLIPEREYIQEAKNRAQSIASDNPEFIERAGLQAQSLYRRNLELDRLEDAGNKQTIADALAGSNPPGTIEDLLKDPNTSNAYYQLEPQDRLRIQKEIASRRAISDPAEFQRLRGMASLAQTDEETRKEFLNEDIIHNTKMSSGHWSYMLALQDKVRKQSEIEPRVSLAMSQLSTAGLVTPTMQKDKDLMARLRGVMWDQIEAYEKVHKAYPKPEEIRDIGGKFLSQPENLKPEYGEGLAGFWHRYAPQFLGGLASPDKLLEMEPPKEVQDKISQDWTSRKGYPPTPEQIRLVYLADQYQKLYGKK